MLGSICPQFLLRILPYGCHLRFRTILQQSSGNPGQPCGEKRNRYTSQLVESVDVQYMCLTISTNKDTSSRKIFPSSPLAPRQASSNWASTRIRERRAALGER